jgi:hypothetical protein
MAYCDDHGLLPRFRFSYPDARIPEDHFGSLFNIRDAREGPARDAIVNCLILSRCEALLKTASILSAWSKLFNPRLPVVMLNRPPDEHLWFPERVLVGENLFEPLG